MVIKQGSKVLHLLTFDVSNTLLRLKKPVGYYYCQVAEMYGLKEAERKGMVGKLNENFLTVLKEMRTKSPMYGSAQGISNNQWWSEVVRKVLLRSYETELMSDDKRIGVISSHLFKLFSTSQPYELIEGANFTLNYLKTSFPSLKLGVISNSDERLVQIITELSLRHYFDFLILPQLDHVEKPSNLVFELALEKASIEDPSRAVHVGDSITKDYLAAKACSWNAILLDRESQSLHKEVKNCDIITKLDQIRTHQFFKKLANPE